VTLTEPAELPSPAALPDAPAGLLDAFLAYERALMANDLAALDELFLDSPSTLRGDAAGILVGHDAISEFRRGRGGAPRRALGPIEVRSAGDDAALVIAVTLPATGGRGQQTQLWRRTSAPGEAPVWRVEAAHVSLPQPAIAASVWRVAGSPLVPATATGPLDGETVAVKDLFAVTGVPTGGGVPAYLAEQKPQSQNADAVDALLEHGAAVAGIAHTDEFAYSIAGKNPHYGTPPNGAVLGAIPGGSSSGPASAVALGQASIGLGTDTGGSIRVPASYQGLWGLRTTHGLVSTAGLLPLAPSFDTVGWLTRDADTLRRAASASLGGQRALSGDLAVAPALLEHLEPDVRRVFESFVHTVPVTEVELDDIDHLFETFRTVQAAEAWREHGSWIDAHPGALGDAVAGRFAWAASITQQQEDDARAEFAAAKFAINDALGARTLLLPAASSVAPSTTADEASIERTRSGTLRLTCIAGLSGRPALSAPLLSVPRPGSLFPAPVGLCFVGPRSTDLALIELAESLTE
jgi:Asp-tRNA(Asn)/Glu-tRNA(Gln) amidotransferase A subunit family amidase